MRCTRSLCDLVPNWHPVAQWKARRWSFSFSIFQKFALDLLKIFNGNAAYDCPTSSSRYEPRLLFLSIMPLKIEYLNSRRTKHVSKGSNGCSVRYEEWFLCHMQPSSGYWPHNKVSSSDIVF